MILIEGPRTQRGFRDSGASAERGATAGEASGRDRQQVSRQSAWRSCPGLGSSQDGVPDGSRGASQDRSQKLGRCGKDEACEK